MRLLRVGLSGVGLVLLVASCAREPLPPQGHVLLFFDTDATMPPPSDQAATETDVAPLFERMIVEVFEPNADSPCAGCRREFAVDRRMFEDARASIQVPAIAGVPGYRVRVRLFLTRNVTGTEPSRESTVEVVASLPTAPDEGGLEATVFLATEDVGVPRGTLTAPIATTEGRPVSSKVGSWPGATAIPCVGTAGRGEACVPGGAFWMGSPAERRDGAELQADRTRLVVVSPYFLDENEVTVADIRAFARAEPGVMEWNGLGGGKFEDFCTFTSAPGPHDALPVSCILWSTARHYCISNGKELPTEAEFERVAGALASKHFPWGDDPPTCGDAVWGRGGILGILAPCRGSARGPACIGAECMSSRGRDFLALKSGTLHDLAGNIGEWMLDRFSGQDEPFWARPGIHTDPLCTSSSSVSGDERGMVMKGGRWLDDGQALAASRRNALNLDRTLSLTGFRCTRKASPEACGPVTPGLFAGSTHGGDEGTLVTVGIGCSGVVSAVATHADGSRFNLVGTIDGRGHVALDGLDDDEVTFQKYVGDAVDAQHVRGTWTSNNGKSGTWSVAPKSKQ